MGTSSTLNLDADVSEPVPTKASGLAAADAEFGFVTPEVEVALARLTAVLTDAPEENSIEGRVRVICCTSRRR